ncbi:MAG TPA: sialidase family protein [Kofleriaceae bacterium]|nr:sialidase family protein [Kofleriaceae bacterium]
MVPLSAALAACGGSSADSDPAKTPRPLVFERWSPAQQSSYDVFVAASGSVVLMASRISRDGGATWAALDPQVGTLGRVAISGSTVFLYSSQVGLARWDLTTDQIAPIGGAPGFASDRTWRRDPGSGRFVVFDPVNDAVAIEGPEGWTTAALPRPAPTECCAYITDLESNGATLLSVSGWGVHRSTDGGATWQLAAPPAADAGRDLLVLGDGRFALVGGASTYLFTAGGAAAGVLATLVVGDDAATVCDDGSIVVSGATSGTAAGAGSIAPGMVTHDLGATWQPLATAGDLAITIERASCGAGAYWVLMQSAAWGYRLLRYTAPGMPGTAVGNWDAAGDQAWASGGPSIVRTDDGTYLAGGLAWRDGDAAWTLREMPALTWSSGGTLFGAAGAAFYTSDDAGVTWTAIAAAGLAATDPGSFARTPDGALYVGQLTGQTMGTTDSWQATVWRSADQGASWSSAYAAMATRASGQDTTGEAHGFVGIMTDGTWVATDAVSSDAGATWQDTQAVGDRSLAHLMADGSLVMQPADASGEIWRVYADGGRGMLRATHAIAADGQPVLAASLRSVAFDDAGYAYVARGTPHVQIWRSTTPVGQPTASM